MAWGFALPQGRVLIIVAVAGCVAAASFGVGLVATSGSRPIVGSTEYQANFTEVSMHWLTGSGWIRYGATIDHNYTVEQTNMTWITFRFEWNDEAGSPLANPDVRYRFEQPDGTVVFEGPVTEGQLYEWNISLNAVPEDARVTAESADEAFRQAAPLFDEMMGTGTWNYTLMVGDMPYARNQIRSGIFTDTSVDFGFVEATVQPVAG